MNRFVAAGNPIAGQPALAVVFSVASTAKPDTAGHRMAAKCTAEDPGQGMWGPCARSQDQRS